MLVQNVASLLSTQMSYLPEMTGLCLGFAEGVPMASCSLCFQYPLSPQGRVRKRAKHQLYKPRQKRVFVPTLSLYRLLRGGSAGIRAMLPVGVMLRRL